MANYNYGSVSLPGQEGFLFLQTSFRGKDSVVNCRSDIDSILELAKGTSFVNGVVKVDPIRQCHQDL